MYPIAFISDGQHTKLKTDQLHLGVAVIVFFLRCIGSAEPVSPSRKAACVSASQDNRRPQPTQYQRRRAVLDERKRCTVSSPM